MAIFVILGLIKEDFMFENLSQKIGEAIKKARGFGKISEDNIQTITQDIKVALLEADVSYQVVKEFISQIKEKALGEKVQKSLNPAEAFVKIVHQQLVELLGNDQVDLIVDSKLNKLMLIGLQGSGKTTTIGKLALFLRKKHKKKPLLVACDVYRPAAIEQLMQIGKQLDIEVYTEEGKNPVEIAKNALVYAKKNHFDYLLIDTAGRLHIDQELMNELKEISNEINPDEILLTLDSMIGQDAINVIEGFNQELKLTGAILTKMDGDAKGGVALSLRHLTNVPIKFVGVSEKMDGLESFYPDRIANRILGMGDILSMVEKANEVISEEEAKDMAKKMERGKFDLEDFLNQMNQIKKMGPIENIIKMIPGASKMGLNNVKIDPKAISHMEAIVLSMTKKERKNPDLLKANHKKRIAFGSGRSVEEINRLLKQFEQMKTMMKQLKNGQRPF